MVNILFAVYNPESSLGTQVQAIMKFVESHAAQLSKVPYGNDLQATSGFCCLVTSLYVGSVSVPEVWKETF